MPLYDNAIELIRTNLEQLQNGERPKFQAIGKLTDEQLETINQKQIEKGFPIVQCNEILYMGRHHYESRVIRDGYQIDDLIKQIESSLAESSVIENNKILKSTIKRDDGYGNMVEDWAVFEMTAKRPKMELFSVIPKGDNNKPSK
ncbi:hypothetical protein [Moraxella marmotae]|uniref:hypothetical protein n=1 Tax=Moraxella marmotae TaxID=3344520 RepID=UPI0035F3BE03